MVTHLQHIAARVLTAPSDALPGPGILSRALGQLQSAFCGLHGHDPMLHFEEGRMFLRCSSCGHESPGWATGEKQPRVRFNGDAARHQLQQSAATRSRTIA